MINPKDLTPNDIGRRVVYKNVFTEPEYGILTSWNECFVFVCFKGTTGEACPPRSVSFVSEEQPGGSA